MKNDKLAQPIKPEQDGYIMLAFFAIGVVCIIGMFSLFLGFYGMQTSVKVNRPAEEPVVTTEEEVESALSWTLPFGELNVTIMRASTGNTENTLWQKQVVQTKTNNEPIDTVFSNMQLYGEGIIYDPGKEVYYFELSGSSYRQLSVISKEEVDALRVSKLQQIDNKDGSAVVIYEREEFPLGSNTNWKAVKFAGYYIPVGTVAKSKEDWSPNGYAITCYIPIAGTTSYLAFEEPLHAVGVETNMCDYLSEIGVIGAKRVTVSVKQAVAKVAALSEVKTYLKNVKNGMVTFDHENEDTYSVHVYEINQSNVTATYNWFDVNKETGAIAQMFTISKQK
jgi:hypothetical protein